VRRLLFCLIAMLALAPPAAAQPVITSSAPDTVSVTVYRAPNRAADAPGAAQ
jgi:hypothetical protein